MIFTIAFLSITLIKLLGFNFKEINKDIKKIEDISRNFFEKENEENYGIFKSEVEFTYYYYEMNQLNNDLIS